jgi:hypothetical protein
MTILVLEEICDIMKDWDKELNSNEILEDVLVIVNEDVIDWEIAPSLTAV